jgi:hypothetical protein
MSQETPQADPRKQTGKGTFKQTDEPSKGNPEKEQRSHVEKDDPERWQKGNTN